MFQLTKQQQNWLDFLWAMTEKEIKTRYKFAALGFLWIVLNPVLQMTVIGIIFQFIVHVDVDNYFIFLLAGLLPWNFFSYTVVKNTPMIVYERSLIQKAKFPREAIILSIVLSNFFHTLIALGTLIIFLLIINELVISTIWLLLPALFFLLLITAGCSLLFATLNVKYRDVSFAVSSVFPLLFYATPIMYISQLIPESLRLFIIFNPMTGIIQLFQYALAGVPLSSLMPVVISFAVSIGLALYGWWLFQHQSKYFTDWL